MKLIDAVKLALKLVKGKSKLNVLNHLRLKDGILLATDLQLWLQVKTDYSGPEAVLPALRLKELLKKAKTLNIEPGSEALRFKASNGAVQIEIEGLAPEDFPEASALPADSLYMGSFMASRLQRAKDRLAGALSKDETRYVLQDYFMEVTMLPDGEGTRPGDAMMVATNGHVLSTAWLSRLNAMEGPIEDLRLPEQAVDLACAGQKEGFLNIHRAKGEEEVLASLAGPQVTLLWKRDARESYPNWRVVTPRRPEGIYTLTLESRELDQVLEAVPFKDCSVNLVTNGVDCHLHWPIDGKRSNPCASLKVRERQGVEHASLEVALRAQYLRWLTGRTDGRLQLRLGAQATPKGLSNWSLHCLTVKDSDTQDGEVTVVMPMREDKVLPADAAAPAEAFLMETALRTGFFTQKQILEGQIEDLKRKALDASEEEQAAWRNAGYGDEYRARAEKATAEAAEAWKAVYALERDLAELEPPSRESCLGRIRAIARQVASAVSGPSRDYQVAAIRHYQDLLEIRRRADGRVPLPLAA